VFFFDYNVFTRCSCILLICSLAFNNVPASGWLRSGPMILCLLGYYAMSQPSNFHITPHSNTQRSSCHWPVTRYDSRMDPELKITSRSPSRTSLADQNFFVVRPDIDSL
ncbi:hypothetical protein P692DRAFT_20911899, partial [Suillus brevipes Sb2]